MGPAFKAGPSCAKCQGNIKTCPGHFGFFYLAVPIYHPAFIEYVQKILNLFCYACWNRSQLEIDRYVGKYVSRKEKDIDMEKFSQMNSAEKDAELSKATERLMEEALQQPGAPRSRIVPLFNPLVTETRWPDILGYKRLKLIEGQKVQKCVCQTEQVVYKLAKNDWYITRVLGDNSEFTNPKKIQQFLEAIDNDVNERGEPHNWARKLGLGENKLRSFVMTAFPVLPNTQRPSTIESNSRPNHHSLSVQYASIIADNRVLKEALQSGTSVAKKSTFDLMLDLSTTQTGQLGTRKPKEEGKSTPLKNYYDDMNRKIRALFFAKDEKAEEGFDYERPGSTVPVSLLTITNGKYGLLRKDIMGKGSNFSGRAVVIGDPNIDVDECGISEVFAESVTIPEDILDEDLIEKWSAELPRMRPDPDDPTKMKMQLGQIRKVEKANGRIITLEPDTKITLQIGDVVKRILVEGDIIVLSRQPVLHKGGLMGFYVRIFKGGGNVLRINPAVTGPFNADFDGDEMNFAVPQNPKSRKRTQEIMMVTNCIRGDQNSSPWIGLIQNAIIAGKKLTMPDKIIEEDLKFRIWSAGSTVFARRNPGGIFRASEGEFLRELYKYRVPINPASGRATLSYFFPRNFNYERRRKGEESILVERGMLLSGTLDKSDLGKSSNGIVDTMLEQYGAEVVIVFLSAITRGLYEFIVSDGSTIGVADCRLQKLWDPISHTFSVDPQETINSLVTQTQESIINLMKTSEGSGDLARFAENEVKKRLSELSDRVNAIAKSGGIDIVAMKKKLEGELQDLRLQDAVSLATGEIAKGSEEDYELDRTILTDLTETKMIDDSRQAYLDFISQFRKRIETGKLGTKSARDLDDVILLKEITALKVIGQKLSRLSDAQLIEFKYRSMALKVLAIKELRDDLMKSIQSAINTRVLITGANKFTNRFLLIVYSGAKGTATNYSQVLGLVGQQEFEGGRFQPQGALKRTMPFYEPGDLDPVSQGMCFSSFANGLTLPEYILHASAARGNIVESNLKPAITGYFYRRAWVMMGDIRAQPDGSARDEAGRIVQFAYGGDSFDPRRLINVGKGGDPQFINMELATKSIRTEEGKTEYQLNEL